MLGVIIDNKLSFEQHIKTVKQKISSSICMINHLKSLIPMYLKRSLYFAHIQSHLSYCINIFGSTYPTHMLQLFKIQKRALRILTNSDYQAPSDPLFKDLKILKLFDLVKLEIGTYVYKNKNSDIFHHLNHQYNTRRRLDFALPAHNLSIFQNSLSYNSIKVWNAIEDNIKNKSSVKSFRFHYKKKLMSNY